MCKKVLILSGSLRKESNSDLLCNEFLHGKRKQTSSSKIEPCIVCYYCRYNDGKCIYKDDMDNILQKMIDVDVIEVKIKNFIISLQ